MSPIKLLQTFSDSVTRFSIEFSNPNINARISLLKFDGELYAKSDKLKFKGQPSFKFLFHLQIFKNNSYVFLTDFVHFK